MGSTMAPSKQADLHPPLTALQAPQSLLLLLRCGGIWLRRPSSRDAAGAQSMQAHGFRLLDAAIGCHSLGTLGITWPLDSWHKCPIQSPPPPVVHGNPGQLAGAGTVAGWHLGQAERAKLRAGAGSSSTTV